MIVEVDLDDELVKTIVKDTISGMEDGEESYLVETIHMGNVHMIARELYIHDREAAKGLKNELEYWLEERPSL